MPTPVEQQNCANCYFSRVETAAKVIDGGRGVQEMTRRFCHFNPPPPPSDEVRHSLGWRGVTDDEWCGFWSEDASKNVISITLPETITGAKGDTGAQGPSGVQGDTGPQGNTGPQGAQGPQGVQGDTGPQGVAGPSGPSGADGAAGSQVTFSASDPSGGADGDVWIKFAAEVSGNTEFHKKISGTWTFIFRIQP